MNQKWKWNGKNIVSQMNAQVFDVSGGSIKPGAEVIVYASNNQLNQEWEVCYKNVLILAHSSNSWWM